MAPVDMIYKTALARQALANANKAETTSGPAPIFASDVPGYGNITLEQYKALPTGDRLYISHVLSARQRGETPMTRKAFDAVPDKDKFPATAEAAAVEQLYREHKGSPPQSEILRIRKLYHPGPDTGPKTPTQSDWASASREVTKRFGKLDPTGMWAITPELQSQHRVAQKALVEFKSKGIEPLRAVNLAEEVSNKYYNTIKKINDEAKRAKDEATRRRYILEQTNRLNARFKTQVGFDPGE